MNKYSPERFAPERAALLSIDVQNDFCHPAGVCGKRGSDVSAAVEMVPRLRRLVEAARAAGVLVVHVRTLQDESTDTPVWLSRRGDLRAGATPPATSCYTGSWGAEFYGIEPAGQDLVVTKSRYSGFAHTNLDRLLRDHGTESILVAGVATNVCVESTLRDGLFLDYHVTLIEDCAAAFEPELHHATVVNVERNFGAVIRATELMAHWSSVAS